MASAWAVLNTLGEAGYLRIVEPILQARERLVAGIKSIDGLDVRGVPDAYLVSFGAAAFDIFAVADAMQAQGWQTNRLMTPPSIHLFLDAANITSVDDYLADLAMTVEAAKAGRLQASDVNVVYST